VWIYFRLNQIQEAAARHLGKFRMNIADLYSNVNIWNALSDPFS